MKSFPTFDSINIHSKAFRDFETSMFMLQINPNLISEEINKCDINKNNFNTFINTLFDICLKKCTPYINYQGSNWINELNLFGKALQNNNKDSESTRILFENIFIILLKYHCFLASFYTIHALSKNEKNKKNEFTTYELNSIYSNMDKSNYYKYTKKLLNTNKYIKNIILNNNFTDDENTGKNTDKNANENINSEKEKDQKSDSIKFNVFCSKLTNYLIMYPYNRIKFPKEITNKRTLKRYINKHIETLEKAEKEFNIKSIENSNNKKQLNKDEKNILIDNLLCNYQYKRIYNTDLLLDLLKSCHTNKNLFNKELINIFCNTLYMPNIYSRNFFLQYCIFCYNNNTLFSQNFFTQLEESSTSRGMFNVFQPATPELDKFSTWLKLLNENILYLSFFLIPMIEKLFLYNLIKLTDSSTLDLQEAIDDFVYENHQFLTFNFNILENKKIEELKDILSNSHLSTKNIAILEEDLKLFINNSIENEQEQNKNNTSKKEEDPSTKITNDSTLNYDTCIEFLNKFYDKMLNIDDYAIHFTPENFLFNSLNKNITDSRELNINEKTISCLQNFLANKYINFTLDKYKSNL